MGLRDLPVSLRLTGGGNFPSPIGRVNATWPLVVFELRGDVVSLRMRMNVIGARRIRVRPADVLLVFPVRGVFATAGVGLRGLDGREWYFWTGSGSRVLDALWRQGFPVSGELQRARTFGL